MPGRDSSLSGLNLMRTSPLFPDLGVEAGRWRLFGPSMANRARSICCSGTPSCSSPRKPGRGFLHGSRLCDGAETHSEQTVHKNHPASSPMNSLPRKSAERGGWGPDIWKISQLPDHRDYRQQKAYKADDPHDFRTSTKLSRRVLVKQQTKQQIPHINAELPASPHGPTTAYPVIERQQRSVDQAHRQMQNKHPLMYQHVIETNTDT